MRPVVEEIVVAFLFDTDALGRHKATTYHHHAHSTLIILALPVDWKST